MYIDYFNAVRGLFKGGLSGVRTVDYYNGQYDRYEECRAVDFPVVYVEFGRPTVWTTQGRGFQTSDTVIRLHLVLYDVGESPQGSLTLADSLHRAVHLRVLYKGADQLSTELVRTESELLTEYSQVKIVVLTYATTLYDTGAMQEVATTPVELRVKSE